MNNNKGDTGILGRDAVGKIGLLLLLGFLWSMRLAAIKAAGLSGIPVEVVVSVAALGIAVFFSALAISRSAWPPVDKSTMWFYIASGTFGFLAPFALESFVAPQLPVFLFVVVISTMPIMTLILSTVVKAETLNLRSAAAIAIGFLGAMVILYETHQPAAVDGANVWVVAAAFGVPVLYALNTVFVTTRWPQGVSAIKVAHAQALIVSVAAVLGAILSGTMSNWTLVQNDPVSMILIILGEALALLLYLRITRDFGATYVSLANYISMGFAALFGAVFFNETLTLLTILSAACIIAAVGLHRRGND